MFAIKERKTAEEVHALYKGTFGTEFGERTLKHLAQTFIDRPIYANGLTPEEVAFREGEASVIRKIIKEVQGNGRFTITDDTK